jgi:hypothetical protein
MPLSTFNFERPVPQMPWRRMAIVAAVVVGVAALGWELRVRAMGYGTSYNDTADLWAEQRTRVKPESIVIIGDSRAWFDLDLDELERGLGRRPIQLALPGSCAYPVLAHFADDRTFRGTVICSVVPAMFFAPGGFLVINSEKALKRHRDWTPTQRIGHYLALPLERTFAFLKQEELTLGAFLRQVRIPNRENVRVMPPLPPYFNHTDRDRRARMIPQAESGPLRDRIRDGWLPLFTPPPPPRHVPPEAFAAEMGKAMEKRMHDTIDAVGKIRARGGDVIFVRFPVTGGLKAHEDRMTPRERTWDPMIQATGAHGIHFEDYPELAQFDCPEWSHLSAADSVEFTKLLVPHLKRVVASDLPQMAKATPPAVR